jgi:hypothetical protein
MPSNITGIGPSQSLTELFGITGKVPLLLDSTVVPVVNIGDVADEVTWGPPACGSLYMGAVVGPNQNVIELSLPFQNETVGLRARLMAIDLNLGAATDVYIRPSPGLAATTHTGLTAWRDTRIRGLPQLLINGKNDAAGLGGTGPIALFVAATTPTLVPLDWIVGIDPDTGVTRGIHIEFNNPLANVRINVYWREGAPR